MQLDIKEIQHASTTGTLELYGEINSVCN